MLTDEERETLLRWQRGEWFAIPEPGSHPELLKLQHALLCQNRAEIGPGNEAWLYTLRPSPMGDKALRIDALIRQWGYRP